MSSRKWPHGKTIKGGHLRELILVRVAYESGHKGSLSLKYHGEFIPSTRRPFKLLGVSCMTLLTYDLIHLLYFIMPALSFDSIDQENFFIKQLNLDSIPCVFSVMCFCCVLSRVKLTPPSTSWGCQRVIYFSYPRLTFGIKRWKLLCIMKHFSQSLGSSRAQVLQNIVNVWHQDTWYSSNGLLCSIPKSFH